MFVFRIRQKKSALVSENTRAAEKFQDRRWLCDHRSSETGGVKFFCLGRREKAAQG